MFTGIPNFAPEMFRRVVLRDPLRMKALQKGLDQLCEEGATQLFRPLRNNDLILGAVGQLQFDVVAFRLQDEYGVQATLGRDQRVHRALGVLRWTRRSSRSSATRRTRISALDHSGRARLPGADAREPAAHARALARDHVPRDARTPRRARHEP